MDKLSYVSGGLNPYTDGTFSGLMQSMQKDKVDASVVLNIATNAHQQKSVNDYAASINNGQTLFAFGSVHFESPDALEELERIHAMGLKGVKLHPDYQGFFADDEKMKPIYQKISSLGLITVFHTGVDYGYRPPYGATPDRMARALRWFDSPVVAAHWGAAGMGEEVIKKLCGLDIYFDTSFGYGQMPKYIAEEIIEKHGTDQLLFGTDTPWHTPEMELRLLSSLSLDRAETDKILFQNAKKLLKIE